MDQQTVFSQMQQFGNEWFKLVAEQTTRVTSALAELENLQKRSLAQAATFVDEAGRVAKESLATAEQFSAQWHPRGADAFAFAFVFQGQGLGFTGGLLGRSLIGALGEIDTPTESRA